MGLLSVSLNGCVLHFASETEALACSPLFLVNMQSDSIFPFHTTLPLGLRLDFPLPHNLAAWTPICRSSILFPLIWTHSTLRILSPTAFGMFEQGYSTSYFVRQRYEALALSIVLLYFQMLSF
ncbi:uncharacterized protein LOC116403981 isoform X2 [Cucumis sativus]|uniref:uncharacterized protein LOC116403981 isoform X2 n=1 Tax=Cucumis sativus TaxID=3659 RepID=UPI0012F49267|nr:uncharacterized protein LOC116403981 isoform X2 [Cucumis sativus]